MKKIKIILIGHLAFLMSCMQTDKIGDKEIFGKPIVILTEANPWLMVVGSDVPTFALYETGQIIYKRIEDHYTVLYKTHIPKTAIKIFLDSVKIKSGLVLLPEFIEASMATDPISTTLIVDTDFKASISVYGSLFDSSDDRKKVPPAFLSAYDKLKGYQSNSAKKWLPDQIEIMAWNFSDALKSKEWPKQWPDLKASSTIKRNGNLYSIYLDKKYFDDLKKYMESLERTQAVVMNGKKLSISFRLPFPNIK